MAIKRPDIYEHNNPNNAISDSDFVRGGIRSKAPNLPALGALASKADQLKEYATFVWVESENKYYVLVDKNNIGNINGWSSTILGSNSGGGGDLPSVMIFRDSLETYAQLEAIPDPRQGDVYSVYNDPNPNKNSRLYVRIENYGGDLGNNIWKDLGISVDLRGYIKSDDLMLLLADYVTETNLTNTLNGYIPTSHPANTVTNNNIASWNNKVDKPLAPDNVNTKVILADGTTKNISDITGMTSINTDSTLKGDGTSGNPLGLSVAKNAEIKGKISKQGINLWYSGNIPEMTTGDISGIYRGHGASNAVYDFSPFFQMTTDDTFAQVHLNYVNGEMAYRAGNAANGYSPIRISWDTGNLVNPATQAWVTTQTTPATQAEVEASTGTASQPTSSEPATEDRKFLSLFNFFKLIKKLRYIHLLPNSATAVANILRSDGSKLFYANNSAVEKEIAYVNDVATLLQQPIKTITSNTTLDNSYHNAIVRVTATCTITVPSTLRADFNAVFEAIGNISATFLEDTNTVFSAPFGKLLKDNSMCNLYKYNATTYRLNGGLLPV